MFKRIWRTLMCKDADQWGNGIPIISPLLFWGIAVPIGHVISWIEEAYDWFEDRRKK